MNAARIRASRVRFVPQLAILRRGTIRIGFSTIPTASQRRFIPARCLKFTHLPVQARGLVYNVWCGRLGRPRSFGIGIGNVYRIVRVSGSSSDRLDECTRAVIAAGFLHAAEARECAIRWVNRFCPDAIYLPDSDRWRVQDEDGSIHLFCIEPTAADDARSAA